MRILFGSTSQYFPQHFGGIAACIDNLSRGLVAKGHQVAVLATLAPGGSVWLRNRVATRLLGFSRAREKFHGYWLFREWEARSAQAIDRLVAFFSPDIFVGHGGYSLDRLFTARAMAAPFAAHLHGMPPLERANQLYEKGVRNYISCSFFVESQLIKQLNGTDAINASVIYNAFDPTSYRVDAPGDSVTLINPNPIKGVDVALALADALPEIPFLFVGGWRNQSDKSSPLEARIRSRRNITTLEATDDMRSIYRRTRILLVPSQVDEGASRVITEAQISGIPIIGSNRGGIPEMLGEGGVVLPHDDVTSWIRTLRDLWDNEKLWQTLSKRAIAQAEDARFSYRFVLDRYEDFLITCIARHRSS